MMIKNTSLPTLYNYIARDTNNISQQGQVYVLYKIEPDRVIATPPLQW